jgi:hypothetical protein
MPKNTNASDGFDSSDSILSESTQSCQDLSKSTQTCQNLVAAINNFPQEWALTPCIGKRNLWPAWNTVKLDRAQLIEAIRSQTNHEGKPCKWTGVSIVTGPLSNGVMAIDFDGPAAWKKYLELSGNQAPPFTNHWTSGKAGHFQILLSVLPEKWEGLKPQKIELENGNKLELRWNQCSTLPPSIHPDTGKPYFWESEADTPIAECPDFILDLMREAPTIELPQKPKPENPTYIDAAEKSLVDLLESEILPRLDAEEFYGSYLKLKPAGKNLKALCPFHQEKTPSFTVSPAEKTFHCFGCGVGGGPVQFIYQLRGGSGSPTGKDFYSVVMELADRVGVKIGDRKFKQNPESKTQNPKPNNLPQHPAPNVIRPPQFQIPPIAELEGEIETLLGSDLKKSQLQLKISELAQKFRINSADIWKVYRERELELEQEASQEDTRIGIEQLLASQAASVKLSEIFPESLAAPIEEIARRMNLKPECYALALISGISRFLKNGSSTMLVDEWNYWCRTHGYFGAMIAESSQMKTPVLNAMISDPLASMRKANQEKFKAQEKAYKEEIEQWKNSKDEDKGPPPDAPVEKLPYITKATWEGVARMVDRAPTQGILWLCDELAGFFKSANQYRSGRGSDQEDLLECWSGNGAVIARAAGTTVNVGAVSLSIYGNIQPKVLAPFLGDGSDDNGTFARFDFVQQPRALTQITLGLSRIDINPMMQALYERVDAIPLMQFELDEEAKKLFVAYYNHCQRLRFDHPKQGMRAMLGKAAEKVGRVATILHCIHAAHLGGEVSQKIPASRVRAAIKWIEYTTQQALSINIEVCSPDALESNLAKIISLAERKGGTVSARDVGKSFDSKYRPNAQKIQEWFTELVTMNYGEVTSKGQSILFSLAKTSPSSPLSGNPDISTVTGGDTNLPPVSPPSPLTNVSSPFTQSTGEEWGGSGDTNLPTFKSLPDKELRSSGEDGEVFATSPVTPQSLMLSCTTESAEFTDEHHAKMLADKMREAIASSNFEGAKEIVKQINVSTSQLRASFWQNLDRTEEKNKARLLAFANLSEGTPVKYVGKIEQYAQEKLTAYDADGHGGITCLLADGRGFTTWIPTRDLRKL